MKNWNRFISEMKEDAPANAMGTGGSPAMGDTNVKSSGGIAGYDPILGVQKKKKKIDARTREFKKKVEQLNKARQKREIVKLEKKYGIKLRG